MSTKSAYRPDIDGLRAIAVTGVLLYHYQESWLPGGFTGVDVFFVISGFLITRALIADVEAGGFSLLKFYDRRIRRILPALLVMLVATMIAGWFLLMPGDYSDLGQSAAMAAFGFGNFFFFWNTGYFDQAADLQPLLHTWSLGVEEQFYFVWPVALWVGLTVVKSRRLFLVLLSTALVLGFAYSLRKVDNDPSAAFYLPAPRAWELGVGALVAFLPAIRTPSIGIPLGLLGFVLIGVSLFVINSSMPFPGYNAVFACLGAAAVLWPKPHDLPTRLLSARPMVFVGLISYSLYLWHWPVLVLFRHYNNSQMPDLPVAAGLGLVSLTLAYLTWRFVEKPFRKTVTRSLGSLVVSAIAVVAAAGVTVSVASGVPLRVPETVQGMRSLEAMWEWQCPQTVEAFGRQYCAFGADWKSAGRRIALWGDSHAEHFAPLAQQEVPTNTSVLLLRACVPIIDNVTVARFAEHIPNYTEACAAQNEQIIAALSGEHIAKVAIAAAWSAYKSELYTPGQTYIPDSKIGAGLVQAGLQRLLARLNDLGIEATVLADVPQREGDPVACATGSLSSLLRAKCSPEQTATTRESFERVSGRIYDAIRAAVEATPGASAIFPGDSMCDEKTCVATLLGEPLYRDVTHLRRNLNPSTLSEFAALVGLAPMF